VVEVILFYTESTMTSQTYHKKIHLKAVIGAFILLMSIFILFTYSFSRASTDQIVIIAVPGIPGPYCAYGLEKRLLEQAGVESVELLWEEEKIRVTMTEGKILTKEILDEIAKKADYPYKYFLEP